MLGSGVHDFNVHLGSLELMVIGAVGFGPDERILFQGLVDFLNFGDGLLFGREDDGLTQRSTASRISMLIMKI